ncbi:hypothetical protein K443DRAFT_115057, partial [Laccaria amethystina LaAM-08-1]
GPVRSPQYLGRSWTGCSPRLRVLGAKNRTEPDLKTLVARQKKEKKKQPTQVWLKKLLLTSSLAACERPKSAQGTKATPSGLHS